MSDLDWLSSVVLMMALMFVFWMTTSNSNTVTENAILIVAIVFVSIVIPYGFSWISQDSLPEEASEEQ